MTTIKVGNKIITDFKDHVKKTAPSALDQIQVQASIAQMKIFDIHARVMACNCECLGMNAENAIAVCGNYSPPYHQQAFTEVMQKWGLVDEKGNSLI